MCTNKYIDFETYRQSAFLLQASRVESGLRCPPARHSRHTMSSFARVPTPTRDELSWLCEEAGCKMWRFSPFLFLRIRVVCSTVLFDRGWAASRIMYYTYYIILCINTYYVLSSRPLLFCKSEKAKHTAGHAPIKVQ